MGEIYKSVRDTRTRKVEHLGMAKNFFEHIVKARRFIVVARWIRLLLLKDSN